MKCTKRSLEGYLKWNEKRVRQRPRRRGLVGGVKRPKKVIIYNGEITEGTETRQCSKKVKEGKKWIW